MGRDERREKNLGEMRGGRRQGRDEMECADSRMG